MNEYTVRLTTGALVTVYAYSRADLPEALEAEGISRDEVEGVRLIERKSVRAEGSTPYALYARYAA